MNRIIFFILLMFVFSCNINNDEKDDFQKIKSFLSEQHKSINLASYSKLIVLNDKGDCIECNNTYAKYIAKNINDKNTLFIISQDGTKIDISSFIEHENAQNIIFDYRDDFSDLKIMRGSGIIKIVDEEVTEKLIITPQNIEAMVLFE